MANEIDVTLAIATEAAEHTLNEFKSEALKFGAEIAGIFGAAFTLEHMVEEASKAEEALHALSAAMQITGTFTDSAQKSFVAFAESLSESTTASKDAILQGSSLLVSLGKLQGEGLEKATKAALDLSAGLNIDLDHAFQLIARSSTGSAQALQRYGIHLDESIPKSQKLAAAVDQINSMFGGSAEAKMDTFGGAITHLGNTFNELSISLGNLIIKSPVIRELITSLSEIFESTSKSISKFGSSGDVLGKIVVQLLQIGTITAEYILPPIELLARGAYAAFFIVGEAIQKYIILPLISMADIVTTVGSVLHIFSKETANTFSEFKKDAQGTLEELNKNTESALDHLFDFDASAATVNLLAKIRDIAQEAHDGGLDVGHQLSAGIMQGARGVTFKDITDEMSRTENKIKISSASIAQHINQSLVTGMSNAFVAFGKAVATGGNAFEAFGKSVLTSMGQMLIYFGEMMIAIGLSLSTVPMLFGLQGAAAVATGIAATILGGVLLGLGGSGAPATSGSSSGGGGGATTADNTQPSTIATAPVTQAQVPQTNVTVQIQGNVLDRRQTGLEIANVIQETFGSNGIVFATSK